MFFIANHQHDVKAWTTSEGYNGSGGDKSKLTFPSCLHLFLRTFQQPNPFCCNKSTTNLFMISFLSRTVDFFYFFLSLWIYLWLAETSQQPISQTTWLKAHGNHCNHLEASVTECQLELSCHILRCGNHPFYTWSLDSFRFCFPPLVFRFLLSLLAGIG